MGNKIVVIKFDSSFVYEQEFVDNIERRVEQSLIHGRRCIALPPGVSVEVMDLSSDDTKTSKKG